MPLLGLDYSGGRPGGKAIAAAGYGFVVRYLTGGGARLPGKLLTAAEYADLQAHTIAIVANWETTANRMKAGYDAGRNDARRADAALRRLGHPAGRPVYFSADFDATPSDQVAIDSYLNGVSDVIGQDRTGVYGSYYVVKRCHGNGTARWGWQTGAWSGGQREPRAHIYQRIGTVTVGGVECDVNEALQADFGQSPAPIVRPRRRKERHLMQQLPATPMPTDPNDDPATWPQRNYDVLFDVAGGWEGDCAIAFGVQEFSGRTVDDARGFLSLAAWITADRRLVPVDPAFSDAKSGRPILRHNPTAAYVAPDGAVGISLNYAAPGGAGLAEGRSA